MSESSTAQAANTALASDGFSVAAAIGTRASEGGIVLWLLGAFSIVVLAIVLVKLIQFARFQIWSRAWLEAVWREPGSGGSGMEQTLTRVRAHPSPVARVVEAVLRGRLSSRSKVAGSRAQLAELPELPEAELREEVERVAHEQLGQLESGLRGLESIGTLAPLLGLLGTVLGMIQAFAQLEHAGPVVDPSILSGGIWEALLTTAVGLSVAIPALAALAWFDGQVEAVRRQLGDAATRALAIVAWRSGESLPPAAAGVPTQGAEEPTAAGGAAQHAL